jgi:hypothetical protein
MRFWGIAEATIEGLAFGARSSREADEVSRPRCLSTRQKKEASPVKKKSMRFWGIAVATIEDLAFGVRSSREPDGVGQRVCLSGASYAAAEKSE